MEPGGERESQPLRPVASNAALVRRYLAPRAGRVAAATAFALMLGAVSALVSVALGPSVTIITTPADQVLRFVDLVGPRLGAWLVMALGREAMTAGALLGALPLTLVGLAVVKALLGLTQWYLWESAGEWASLGIRRDLVTAYLAVDPSRRRGDDARAREAELSSAVTGDVRMMREYIVHFYGGLPRELFQTVFSAILLVLLSPKLFLIFALGVAPVGIIFGRIGRKLRRRAAAALADYSLLSEWLQQRLLGIETIKHYGTEATETLKMCELTTNLYQRFLGAARLKARTSPLTEAVAALALTGVLIVALGDVAAGRASGATQLSFFATLAMLSQSASKLARYLNSNREGAAAVDRLRGLLGFLLGEAKAVVTPVVVVAGAAAEASIACAGLTVRYPATDTAALRDFTFQFTGGRVYCLVGPSGAGKSTAFNAILGLVTPTAGTLAFAGGRPAAGGLWMTYMPQRVQLVPDSIAANVAYPDETFVAPRVIEALERVGLGALWRTAPLGVETVVGEGGLGVSGGQAQRILLARLWYHQAPYVLVDEGTSALDPEVELLVHTLLRDLASRGAVVLTIAHRPAGADAADELLLLHQGQLVAHGAPRVVMGSAEFRRILH